MSDVNKALSFAVLFHEGQMRKRESNGIRLPFISHPLDVLKTLWKWGTINEAMACAAILHDTVEDTSLTADVVNDQFGLEVADHVCMLTHDPSWESKEEYLKNIASGPIRNLIIKLADRICNVNDFVIHDPAYAEVYAKKATCLFEALYARENEVHADFGEKAYQKIVDSVAEMWSNVSA